MKAPAARRDADSIQTVGDFATLAKGLEKGVFVCISCGTLLTDILKSLPNNGRDYVRQCPGCKAQLFFNAGWLTAKMIEAQQRKKQGLGPAIEPGSKAKPKPKAASPGTVREEPLPDGRKRIIVTPLPADSIARAKL